MSTLKRILKSGLVRQALFRMGSVYIRFVYASGRWQTFGADVAETFWKSDKPFILCFWHGRLMMMPYCWDLKRPIHMMVSEHRDGQFIAHTVKSFGVDTVTGSSSKGGAKALRAMVKLLASGIYVGLTPDGPRGPRMRASAGIVSLARLSGVPIIPVAYSSARGRNLRSWDRFLVAWPFSRGVYVWGEPIEVARDIDEDVQEQARLQVEAALNAVTREADMRVGRTPVEPAGLTEGGT